MESDIDAAARFEVNRFMYACAGTIAGPTLTDSQQHTLFHQFKKVLEDAEYKINLARTPPPGHIIDDEGVVRRVLGTLPVTADGCVVQVDEDVYHPESQHKLRVARYDESYWHHNESPLADDCEFCAVFSYYEHDTGYSEFEMYDLRKCYSTREAAEAAKEAKK